MNRIPLLLNILLVLLVAQSKAQIVTIPDSNFANKLTQLFPSSMNGNQMNAGSFEIQNTIFLDVSNSYISDLTGIEHFVNLNLLNCQFNELTSLSGLSDSLETLYCQFNQLTNLPGFTNKLKRLYCDHNPLNSLPPLPSFLEVLKCENCQINSLPALPNTLKDLYCGDNQLTALPALPGNLINLQCYSNQLTNLPALPNTLKYIACGDGNPLNTLPTLPTSLEILYCNMSPITVLPPLPANLEILYCEVAELTNLPALPDSLKFLSCGNNQLSSLPTLPDSLVTLYCSQNQLTSLPVLPNNLKELGCSSNQLNSLPQTPGLMNLFSIANNNISCLVNLPYVSNPANGSIANNPLTCVPNQTNYSLGLPLCLDNDPLNNPNNCAGVNITGNVYTDMNGDCNANISDLQTENIPVNLFDNQNNLLASSYTFNGVYSFTSLQPDTFYVKIDSSAVPLTMACGQVNNAIAILNSSNQTLSGINFPVVCNSNYDLKVQSIIPQGAIFPGQQHVINTNITNNEIWYNIDCNSSSYTGTVVINVTGPVTYVSPAANALTPQVNGNTFTYNTTNFNNLNPNSLGLIFVTDTTAQAGNQICIHVEAFSNPLDVNNTNNSLDFCYNVINSYDPNMKEVYPVNVLPYFNDWFTYTIHFQNTGNAPAFNIRLTDTLDTQLDLSTFEIVGYSHPAIVNLNGNVLNVRFNNIMLPDSSSDFLGSMGYFQYRIKPFSSILNGSEVKNTAHIYFDYNPPIITNTTVNHFNFDLTIGTEKLISNELNFDILPNPSSGIFIIKDNKYVNTIEVFNLMGELMVKEGNSKQINLQALPNGIYLVRINRQFIRKLVKE
jgi:uncharacterized repeat protein (TIGR01451 family)